MSDAVELSEVVGKTITSVAATDEEVTLTFSDGSFLRVQSDDTVWATVSKAAAMVGGSEYRPWPRLDVFRFRNAAPPDGLGPGDVSARCSLLDPETVGRCREGAPSPGRVVAFEGDAVLVAMDRAEPVHYALHSAPPVTEQPGPERTFPAVTTQEPTRPLEVVSIHTGTPDGPGPAVYYPGIKEPSR